MVEMMTQKNPQAMPTKTRANASKSSDTSNSPKTKYPTEKESTPFRKIMTRPAHDTQPSNTKSSSLKAASPSDPLHPPLKKTDKTRIIVKLDVGFPNNLYLRGNGPSLNWDKGILLKNVKADEWIWEIVGNFDSFEFKVLLNDKIFESGENHILQCGKDLLYTPQFL